jgi:hypothetical protein
MEKIIKLTSDNIASEHICCAFADKKCLPGYNLKKEWLSAEFKNGYTFKKLDVRGKVFIEYVPSEHAWIPVDANNYMFISCFWVSGQYAGKGNGKRLLEECITDSKEQGKDGIFIITGDKKRPFMSDPKFLKKHGFERVDTAIPFFELWRMKLKTDAAEPRFLDSARTGECKDKNGIVVYYSDLCPFNDYYINVSLRQYADSKGVPLKIYKIESREQALNLPVPFLITSVFYNGKFVSQLVKPDKDLDAIILKM